MFFQMFLSMLISKHVFEYVVHPVYHIITFLSMLFIQSIIADQAAMIDLVYLEHFLRRDNRHTAI